MVYKTTFFAVHMKNMHFYECILIYGQVYEYLNNEWLVKSILALSFWIKPLWITILCIIFYGNLCDDCLKGK